MPHSDSAFGSATILLRRNKETTLDGQKLIELPAKTTKFEDLDFGEEEREIYEFVQQKSAAVFNRYLRVRVHAHLRDYT